MAAVEKLDALLDSIRPTEAEAPPDTPLGTAWDSLIGSVARAQMRADDLITAVTPLYKRLGSDSRGAPPPPGASRNGLNGTAVADPLDSVADF